ncbi:MAG: tripartite tricarboxylate transporter substrate binding protein [Candidatus Parcubacteria bacterium]|nr:tripartite tricarboxylate transporter substrate binding protein [Burkholderiales bacterium]
MRKYFFSLAGCVLAALGAAATASAQEYPSRPLQIIVGYGPGGGTDILARVIAAPLSKILGQPVIVRNLPGAGGQIAASALLREGADGLAILAINQPDLYMGVALNTAPYKATEFQVIMVDVKDPRVLLVSKGSDIGSLADFVARARAQPGKLGISYAQGSAQELFTKWLAGRLGLDLLQVGYKGGSDAVNAMLGGQVSANLGDDFARINFRQQSRALFVASREPSPRWPEAQTLTAVLAPLGIVPPSADFLARYGVYVVPSSFKQKHAAAYAKLQQALLSSRKSPEFQDYIGKNALQDLSIGKPGEEFDAAFAADMLEVAKLK